MCWPFSFTALALWEASTCKSKDKRHWICQSYLKKICSLQDNFPQVETILSQGRNDPDKR